MVEEKARLAEEKAQLKKNCREEKAKLDLELEKIKARRQKIEEDENNAQLKEIDDEFEAKSSKLQTQKKLLSDKNR